MNSSAVSLKTRIARAVCSALVCAAFCAVTPCFAQDTARGIVAENAGTAPSAAERPDPEIRFQLGHSRSVKSVAWSPNGKYIASGSNDKTVKIWDAASGKELHTLTGHLGDVKSVAWSPDSRYIASGSDDDTVKVWDAASGKELHTLTGHSSDVNSVAWSPDGKCIASGSRDNKVKVWDAANGNELRTLSGHSGDVESVAWSPDGKCIASGGWDNTVKVWDAANGNELRTLSGHSHGVNSVAWSPDGRYIASDSRDNTVKVWDAASGKELRTLIGHSYSVRSVAWSPDSKYIASGSDNATMKVWDVSSGKELKTLSRYSDKVYSFTHNSRLSPEEIASGQSGYVKSVAWSPDGKCIVSTSYNFTVKVSEVSSENELYTLTGHSRWVNSVAWSPDGKYIASAGDDNTVKVWDAANGNELHALTGYLGWVVSVAWSPDGRYIASGDSDETVKVWDAANGKELRTLSGHSNWVNSVAWSPDGKCIASGSWDNTVKVWDATSGRELLTLKGHSDCVNSVSWSPDSKYIASGSNDGTIKIWDAQSGALLSTTINGNGNEWLTYTPEGFFCGSEWATKNLVYIVDGMDVIGIDQVYDAYYRPDLVAAKIRGEDISSYASSVQLASLVRSGSAPLISFADVPSESSGRDMTFGVSVRNTGGGIGAVNLLLNGKAIRLSDGVASKNGETVVFHHTVTLQNGSNTLEAFALNGAGLVESVRANVEVVWRGATEKPDLYVLTAAVNKYRDKSLWLNYAVPDAEAIADGFQKQKSGLYRNVHISQLNDGEVTKENLASAFSRLSQSIRADDVFVFFVSGHGTTYDDGDYYYLPSDFRYTSKESIPAGGISKNDLLANLSKIKAGKTLVMLDTCNSGAFLSDFGQRGLSEKTAIDRLTRATGHATLAASSDTQAAMEGYNRHGVFTYVLLEGIAGAADSDGDGYVTLNELSAFVEKEVPERSYEKWGYEQVPQKDLRRQDFPIAGK